MKKSCYYLSLCVVLTAGLNACGLFAGDYKKNSVKGGEVVWRHANLKQNILGTQPLISDNNVYYLQDGHLKCSTLREGKLVWSVDLHTKSDGGFSQQLTGSDNFLYIDLGFDIRAYRKSDGHLKWTQRVSDDGKEYSGIGEPIMSQDETFLYAGRKGYVLKVRKSDGQIARRYPLDRMVPEGILQGSTEPIISSFGDDILYVPASYFDNSQPAEKAGGGNMFAFNATNGDLIWERRITVTVPDRSTPAVDDSLTGSPLIFDIGVTQNKVIVLAGFYIIALNRKSGKPIWKTYFSDGGFDVGLAIKGKAVYAASVGRFATRVNLETGEVMWKRDIKFSNTSITTVQNGRLYFNNSGGGGIWVLDTDDGSVIFNETPPNHRNDDFDVYLSSLGVGEGYMVDVGSEAVYCLRVP